MATADPTPADLPEGLSGYRLVTSPPADLPEGLSGYRLVNPSPPASPVAPAVDMAHPVDQPGAGATPLQSAAASLEPDTAKKIALFSKLMKVPVERFGVDGEGNIVFTRDGAGGPEWVRATPTLGGADADTRGALSAATTAMTLADRPGSLMPAGGTPESQGADIGRLGGALMALRRPVAPLDLLSRAGSQLADNVGPLIPAVAGGFGGAFTAPFGGGVPGAALAAYGGDLFRQGIGNYVLGNRLDDVNQTNAVEQGLGGGAAQGLGALIRFGGNWLSQRRNPLGLSVDDIGTVLTKPEVREGAADLAARAQALDPDIRMTPGQLTGMRSMLVNERQLARKPDVVDDFTDLYGDQRTRQVPGLWSGLMDAISPEGDWRLGANSFRAGAQGVIDGHDTARTMAASPFYESAHESGMEPDITSALDLLAREAESAPRGSKLEAAIGDVRTMLEQPNPNYAPPQKMISGTARVASEDRGPSLFQFLRAQGGVQDQGGELRAMDLHKYGGSQGLVRPSGLTLDRAREMAEEAGYLRPADLDEWGRTDIGDFLEAMLREGRGEKIYPDVGGVNGRFEGGYDPGADRHWMDMAADGAGFDSSAMSDAELRATLAKPPPADGSAPLEVPKTLPVTDYRTLHNAKLEIDQMIDGHRDPTYAVDRNIKRVLTQVQQALTGSLRLGHPDYDAGYQTYIGLSPPVDAAKRGLVGIAANPLSQPETTLNTLRTRDVSGAGAMAADFRALPAFDPATGRAVVGPVAPGQQVMSGSDALNAGLRGYLDHALDTAVGDGGPGRNVAGRLLHQVAATPDRDQALRAALPGSLAPRYGDIVDVLRAMARTLPEGSATATDQNAGNPANGLIDKLKVMVGGWIRNPVRVVDEVGEGLQESGWANSRKRLAARYTQTPPAQLVDMLSRTGIPLNPTLTDRLGYLGNIAGALGPPATGSRTPDPQRPALGPARRQ